MNISTSFYIILGWSYGGYVAALSLSTSELFQCGISVAPVTNWKLYGELLFVKYLFGIVVKFYYIKISTDSTYTERYMGMPNLTDNYKGYEEADLSKHAAELKDKQFLLVSRRPKPIEMELME